MKICEGCGAEYELLRGAGMYRRVMCYTCQPVGGDRKQTYRNKHLKKKYGITQSQYTEMYKEQKGICLICERAMDHQNGTPALGSGRGSANCLIDHCHKTGRVRGLLCFHCNTALGHLQDDVVRMERMINYVRSEGMD